MAEQLQILAADPDDFRDISSHITVFLYAQLQKGPEKPHLNNLNINKMLAL